MEDNAERRGDLDSLMGSRGIHILNDDLKDHIDGNDAKIATLQKSAVTPERLAELNYKLGIKHGFEKVKQLLEGYELELMEQIASTKR